MQKMISIILSVLMIVSVFGVVTVSASTTSEKSGNSLNCKWSFNDKNGTLTISGNGKMSDYSYDVDDPDGYDDYDDVFKVTPNTPWKNYATKIKTVVVENGVKNIGALAFMNCTNLATVKIAGSVSSVGFLSFANCRKLTNISLPNNLTSIQSFAFMNCKKLSKVTIPNSNVKMNIQSAVFLGCSSLKSFNIPKQVYRIGDGAFSCPNLTKITVDKNNKYFVSVNNVLYKAGKKYIIQYAPGKKDTRFTIPSTVNWMGVASFMYCKNLKSVTLPKSIKWIEQNNFAYCTNLETIVIPKSVTVVSSESFYKCNKLRVVFYDGSKKQWAKVDKSTETNLLKATVAYNGAKSAVGLNSKSLTVKKGKTAQLKGYVYYRNGKVSKNVKYKTSNSKVATINSKGKVTGKKKSTCYVTVSAKSNSKVYTKCKVVVK